MNPLPDTGIHRFSFTDQPLRVGCVEYLNARPLIHGWRSAVEFNQPSALCRKLARGELDVALVSSIEYLRRPQYRIVDGISIAAFGPVYSVVVAHSGRLSPDEEIEIDPASETSVALLRCLRADSVAPAKRQRESLTAHKDRRARLLIGDQAIRFRKLHPEYRYWDLAAEWKKVTGLPFVFALWLVRPAVKAAEEIAAQLRSLRDRNLAALEELSVAQTGFEPEFCRRYFRENLRFTFGAKEKMGLREFHRRALACGIDVAPLFELNLM